MWGTAIVSASNGAMALATFARSVVFARMLGPENMGIAALAIAVYGLLGLITDIGFEKLLVQSPAGDSRTMQGAAHLLAALRGIVCAALVFVVAAPLVSAFGEPESANALAILAGVFLIRGFAHTDKWRYQRDSRFGPSAVIDVSGVLASLAAAPLLAVWLGDYRAVAIALVAQGGAEMLASHAVAERSYRWSRDRDNLKELWAFGLPLLLAGVLMFASMQGDRFIVASLFTMEELGVYAVAFGLAQIPVMAIGRVTTTLFLPSLSRVRKLPNAFRARLALCSEVQALLGVAICCPLVLAGTTVITLVFGEEYSSGGSLLGWLALAQAARLMRSATAVAALARGDSKNSLITNWARSFGLLFILASAWWFGTLESVGVGILAAEALAIAVSLWSLSRRHGVHIMVVLQSMITAALVGGLVVGAVWVIPGWTSHGTLVELLLVGAATGLAVLVTAIAMPRIRYEGREIIAALLARRAGNTG